MSKDNWKKRYSFRLTEIDKDIYEYIQNSNESESETIRKLLQYALIQIEKEKRLEKGINERILLELKNLREEQHKNHQILVERIKRGTIISPTHNSEIDVEKEKVNNVVKNSADSLLNSFGMDY